MNVWGEGGGGSLGWCEGSVIAEDLVRPAPDGSRAAQYDVVVASEVIEHVARPALFVQQCAQLVRVSC
jgi:2-polyprenyl-3-methyl-5-hydroxy-6-metoxy-1,4-benzoquinol methylase